ncbi:LysR family transcriptional regulator [Luteimonas gilva]|uniref:LysR family transcriptional regulator n=1 Tax=Luteimonas gilva TaxID=2572684 RepID=A0A4U5JY39_9GAMM|nr:LysR family transcriptional regulator [Luteimonas gilva]TKR33718.1 LysR family transcriptional regulator [Luteimonas gilva]
MAGIVPSKVDRLAYVAAVAEAGGFTAAAERLGVTKSLVSQQVRKLEEELGGALFTRTTRQVRLTAAGRRLLDECAPLLRDLGSALERFGGERERLDGLLRLTAPPDFATRTLAPLVAEFAQRHPGIRFDLDSSEEQLDLVAEGMDLAIRFGRLRDSRLRAARLGGFEQWVIAAPDYVARYGAPKDPAALAEHRWVAISLLSSPLTWIFRRGGQQQTVRVRETMRCNSAQALQALVRSGAGVTILLDTVIAEDVAQGRLLRLLPEWKLPDGAIHAVFPPGRDVPLRVRRFVEFLRERMPRA